MLSLCSNGSIDWIATGAMLQGLGTWAGVAAVIAGSIIGANAWRKQKVAERRLDMAERVLTATHKARRALSSVRSPMMWGHETAAAEAKLEEDDQFAVQPDGRRNRLITAQAYYNRLSRVRDQQLELDECLPMARALFSEELEKAVEKLRHQFWVVQTYVDAYIDDEGGKDEDFTAKIREAMYEMSRREPADEVSKAIAETVATIERICEPALRLERRWSRPAPNPPEIN